MSISVALWVIGVGACGAPDAAICLVIQLYIHSCCSCTLRPVLRRLPTIQCDCTRLLSCCCCRRCSYLSEAIFAKSPLIVTDYPNAYQSASNF